MLKLNGLAIMLLCALTACDTNNDKKPAEIIATADAVNTAKDTAIVKLELSLKDIVKTVMTEQYGSSYNDKYQCWDYVLESSESASRYCMQPSEAKIVKTSQGQAIYFFASNRVDINDDPSYGYGGVDAGLMGAFKLAVDASGKWTNAASNKAMSFGSSGYCGCDKAELTKLGSDTYGWVFTSGGVWQGIVATTHEIVVANGNTFENVSRIPEVREEMQDVEYGISIVDDAKHKAMFPILVTKLKSDKKEKEIMIEFDAQKRTYALPESF